MTVEALRSAIASRASELLAPKLLAAGITHHKKGWRECPCSWCEKKREATLVIGSHVPRAYRGCYVEDMADAWRAEQRVKFRQQMKDLER